MSTQAETDDRVIISAQVSTERRDQLARMAQEADRSLSAEIRRALAAHVERVNNEDSDE